MRMVTLTAVVLTLAGCAGPGDENTASPTAPTSNTTTGKTRPSSAPTPPPATAPTPGAEMPAVVRWVGAGSPAAADGFHTATRDGVSTALGARLAFVTPSGTQCMTTDDTASALACLVTLDEPPTQPADSYGYWVGGWVDFDGLHAQVGSAHADPGGFSTGSGARLAAGSSLRFGDYQCRTDPTVLVCINYAHQSGLRIAAGGVTPLGCLQSATPRGGGIRFAC